MVIAPPVNGHLWLPTPTIALTPNHNYECQVCHARVTKEQLMNDLVPVVCKARKSSKR